MPQGRTLTSGRELEAAAAKRRRCCAASKCQPGTRARAKRGCRAGACRWRDAEPERASRRRERKRRRLRCAEQGGTCEGRDGAAALGRVLRQWLLQLLWRRRLPAAPSPVSAAALALGSWPSSTSPYSANSCRAWVR